MSHDEMLDEEIEAGAGEALLVEAGHK